MYVVCEMSAILSQPHSVNWIVMHKYMHQAMLTNIIGLNNDALPICTNSLAKPKHFLLKCQDREKRKFLSFRDLHKRKFHV